MENPAIKGRKYFFHSICYLCRERIRKKPICCMNCGMVFYCSDAHAKEDYEHEDFCKTIQTIANSRGGLYSKAIKKLTDEEFKIYRIMTLNKCQENISKLLVPMEKEVILFPRICMKMNCRETQNHLLENCIKCGEVSFCSKEPNHFEKSHRVWCNIFEVFKDINIYQEKNGIIKPILPTKIIKSSISRNITMNKVLQKLNVEFLNVATKVCITQAASGPLTVWYGLKLLNHLNRTEIIIHIIGAENEYEISCLLAWESFFLHIIPDLKLLNVIFIGPELGEFPNQNKRLCGDCTNNKRKIIFSCEKMLYHEYCQTKNSTIPDLICFFNPGLHRSTGFNAMDTWPLTINCASMVQNCPIIVTSYTKYESPLDLKRVLSHSMRKLNIILPPSVNIFASKKPERNFISDHKFPLIFKNFYCFLVN